MPFGNTFVLSVDGSFAAFPAQGQIQAGYLGGLKTLVRNLGGDPRKVLEHHDIDPLAFENPDHHIDCTAAVNLFEYCSRHLQDPLFGLHLAEQQDPEVFGCVMALARSAPTLRQGLQSLIDFVPLSASPECEMEVVTGREVAELRWRTDLCEGEQVNYQGLLLLMKTLQMLGGEGFRPRYASLTFGVGRPNLQPLQDRLGCKVNGRSKANAIAFSADLLDRPIPSSNRLLFNLLGSSLAQLRTTSRSGFVEQVEAYVRGALASGHCSVDGCADKLGTSSRTLQKRLTRVGIKFLDIVQDERIRQAKQALLWSDCSLDEIAFRLGYSEQTSFGRAFKRCTGMTPQAFRSAENRKMLGPAAPRAN
ncbi:AraC family transcriptional regulator ligand-binding domain-containing protein [Phenylobacterium sp. LjRoot225]|uniref:AraC family transcriptional regulator ligand-binding domain-containing protein n=1 Tax=Phenylobacterium sp. LjRoot225 TaxID=3342285 RepID=UPI003ECC87CE